MAETKTVPGVSENEPFPAEALPDSAAATSADKRKGSDLEQSAAEKKIEAEQKRASEQRPPVFSWSALEYIQQHRGPRWYTVAGIVLAITVIYAIFTDNWTFAIAAIIFAAVYEYIQRQYPPQKVEMKITDLGIHVGYMFFPYSHIKAFWMHLENGVKTLNFSVHRRVHSNVVVQLDDQDPAAIREYLVGQIPEWEGKHERLGDVIIRLLKL